MPKPKRCASAPGQLHTCIRNHGAVGAEKKIGSHRLAVDLSSTQNDGDGHVVSKGQTIAGLRAEVSPLHIFTLGMPADTVVHGRSTPSLKTDTSNVILRCATRQPRIAKVPKCPLAVPDTDLGYLKKFRDVHLPYLTPDEAN
jgi:hypothetical protein